MIFLKQYWYILALLFFNLSCSTTTAKTKELIFRSSNNNQEINFSTAIKNQWNHDHPTSFVHMQPIPEGQSSEEVILAAVVGQNDLKD
jgi:multiple sugar transport system substrate-binding protein